MSVAERPITQQGLTGLKTGAGGRGPQVGASIVTSVLSSDCPCPSQRQFQDKSYFLGALRTKMSDLTSEIARLGREVDTQQREQSTYLAYDKVCGY